MLILIKLIHRDYVASSKVLRASHPICVFHYIYDGQTFVGQKADKCLAIG